MQQQTDSVTTPMLAALRKRIEAAGGYLRFDEFMATALYAQGLGYYARKAQPFGLLARGGSDFVTAPELSPWFGRTLALALREALLHSDTDEIWEFGAGSGALAQQLLQTLGTNELRRYNIIDIAGARRAQQHERLQVWGERVCWHQQLPPQFSGVVLANELLDAMPVRLLARLAGVWHERGVGWGEHGLVWLDRVSALRPPLEPAGAHDYVTELHEQALAWIRSLAQHLSRGAVYLIDYGFPEHEYYHPQRDMGTLVCHRAHQVDDQVLLDVGEKDISAHLNFTGLALSAQQVGFEVLGYTSQGRFLLNCGLLDLMADAPLAERANAQKLVTEHEMGELFKVLALVKTGDGKGTGAGQWPALGFSHGDRTHTL